jgi:hypothetical protein
MKSSRAISRVNMERPHRDITACSTDFIHLPRKFYILHNVGMLFHYCFAQGGANPKSASINQFLAPERTVPGNWEYKHTGGRV